MNTLYSYTNGNTYVRLFEDGTKERIVKEENIFVTHPESIDVKITNYCDANHSFCHEKSTIAGTHANLDLLIKILSPLPAGVEIAIGGGNPLSHPNILDFLRKLR